MLLIKFSVGNLDNLSDPIFKQWYQTLTVERVGARRHIKLHHLSVLSCVHGFYLPTNNVS